MARILAITNQKGGVGKTTTCINLAAAIAVKKRVLVIDMDPQGNSTTGSGINKNEITTTLASVVLKEKTWEDAICKKTECGYDLLPANENLTSLEVQLIDMPHRERQLFFLLEPVHESYDFIFLDCPPTLSMLTVNALVSADGVIIPMQCEYYALEGLSALNRTINTIRRGANPRLQVEGILRTMYDSRNRLSIAVSRELQQAYGKKIFQTFIPRNVRLAEAPSHGKSIIQYDRNSKGATAYIDLAKEILKRQQVAVVA